VVESARIVDAMDVQDGHRTRRMEIGDDHCASYRGNRCNMIARVGSETVRHHRTVGMAGRVDSLSIYRRPGGEVVEQRQRESDIIDVMGHCVAAASAGIPGQQAIRAGCRSRSDKTTMKTGRGPAAGFIRLRSR